MNAQKQRPAHAAAANNSSASRLTGRLVSTPRGWHLEQCTGDLALLDVLWAGPFKDVPEDDTNFEQGQPLRDVMRLVSDVARGGGLRIHWCGNLATSPSCILSRVPKKPPGAPAYRRGWVNNLREVATMLYDYDADEVAPLSDKEIEEAIAHRVYKYTTCGASFRHLADDQRGVGVLLGSIVEGVEQTTATHELRFPFTRRQYWRALQAVEDEAAAIWNDTHGCEHCWHGPKNAQGWPVDDDGVELVEWPVDPECFQCGGTGRII